MLTEQEFQRHAEDALDRLHGRLADAAERCAFDVDRNAGTLSVEFEQTGERFVVSPNAPVRQIWVSALVRSYKLDWDAARSAFVVPATGATLEELMAQVMGERIPGFAY